MFVLILLCVCVCMCVCVCVFLGVGQAQNVTEGQEGRVLLSVCISVGFKWSAANSFYDLRSRTTRVRRHQKPPQFASISYRFTN